MRSRPSASESRNTRTVFELLLEAEVALEERKAGTDANEDADDGNEDDDAAMGAFLSRCCG
jgi:hypothetical protein